MKNMISITSLSTLSTAALCFYTASAFVPTSNQQSKRIITSPKLYAGKGFGETSTKQKSEKQKSTTRNQSTTTLSPPSAEDDVSAKISRSQQLNNEAVGNRSNLLQNLRSREAEKRDAELTKLRVMRETDTLLQEDAGAAAIPEKVAQRMGKRMLPFVGIPLFGTIASFVGFWYMATYQDLEFQPALVATTSTVFLVVGLLGITYSVLSASWDDDREGSGLGLDEFSKNIDSLKQGLSRTKENALLREKIAGLSEDDIQRALDDQERRQKSKNKKDAWME